MAKIISGCEQLILFPFPQCRTAVVCRRTQIRCSVSATPSHVVNASGARVVHWGCEIESLESASALQNWLSSSGLPPQKLEIRRVDVGERGLVALKNIRKGEKLLFVPPSLVITADSVIRATRSTHGTQGRADGVFLSVTGCLSDWKGAKLAKSDKGDVFIDEVETLTKVQQSEKCHVCKFGNQRQDTTLRIN